MHEELLPATYDICILIVAGGRQCSETHGGIVISILIRLADGAVFVYMVQQSTVYGDNVKQPHLAGKAGYSNMLSKIRKRVEATEKASASQ